jgi:hypothetical protein
MRRGDFERHREQWSPDEDAVVRDLRHLSAKEVAVALGRPVEHVRYRRKRLGIADKSALISPFCPGARTVVCRTCKSCGELLDGSFFRKGGRATSDCVRCKVRKYPVRSPRTKRQEEQSKASVDRLHAITLPLAVNRGNPYTDRDHEVLSDPDLRPLEKAVRLGRTYKATISALSKYGYASKVGLGPKEDARWLIEAPNATTLLEMAS